MLRANTTMLCCIPSVSLRSTAPLWGNGRHIICNVADEVCEGNARPSAFRRNRVSHFVCYTRATISNSTSFLVTTGSEGVALQNNLQQGHNKVVTEVKPFCVQYPSDLPIYKQWLGVISICRLCNVIYLVTVVTRKGFGMGNGYFHNAHFGVAFSNVITVV